MYAQRFLAVGLAAFAVASAEQAWAEDPPQQPLTEKHDTVESAISTPAEDLNLKKTEIPDVLQRAVVDPYDLRGASNCLDIAAEVARLDLALGTDKDVPTSKTASKENPASVLKAGIEAVIPYRGIIRRITGATAHEKEVQKAVDAGFARRGFLKGRALEMKCPAPASPAWYHPADLPPPPVAASPVAESPVTSPPEPVVAEAAAPTASAAEIAASPSPSATPASSEAATAAPSQAESEVSVAPLPPPPAEQPASGGQALPVEQPAPRDGF